MAEVAEERYWRQASPDARTCPSWLNHSVIFVKSVAEGWRICRQVGNISAIFEKRASNVDEGQGKGWYIMNALPHEKSAFVLFTKPPPLEVFSTSAPRSPLPPCFFAQRPEVGNMRSLRQIFREAAGNVAVVLEEQFRI